MSGRCKRQCTKNKGKPWNSNLLKENSVMGAFLCEICHFKRLRRNLVSLAQRTWLGLYFWKEGEKVDGGGLLLSTSCIHPHCQPLRRQQKIQGETWHCFARMVHETCHLLVVYMGPVPETWLIAQQHCQKAHKSGHPQSNWHTARLANTWSAGIPRADPQVGIPSSWLGCAQLLTLQFGGPFLIAPN